MGAINLRARTSRKEKETALAELFCTGRFSSATALLQSVESRLVPVLCLLCQSVESLCQRDVRGECVREICEKVEWVVWN